MSRFTTTARRAAVAAVVLAALVPAAHAYVPREAGHAGGAAAALPEPLRLDRPSGPLRSGAPGAPGAVQHAQVADVPVAADAADRVTPAARPAAPAAIPTDAAPGRHRTPGTIGVGPHSRTPVPVAADAGDRGRQPVPVSADAPDRVPTTQAPADDGGLSWPNVILVALLAAAATLGIAVLLRRVFHGTGTASPSSH